MLVLLGIREILESFLKLIVGSPQKAVGLETSRQLKWGPVFIFVIIPQGLCFNQNASPFLNIYFLLWYVSMHRSPLSSPELSKDSETSANRKGSILHHIQTCPLNRTKSGSLIRIPGTNSGLESNLLASRVFVFFSSFGQSVHYHSL